jgi:hypothetical protein
MINRYGERDAAENLLERRWFSSITAVRVAEAECAALREVMQMAESAWRRACMHVVELEKLRDALDHELAALDECEPPAQASTPPRVNRAMSAA